MREYFPDIPTVKFEGAQSKNPLAFKFYNPDEIVDGKRLRDHLKFSMAYWHTMCGTGSDPFGVGTIDRKYGQTAEMSIFKAKADAAFEFMQKLNLDYYCFHDFDVAPEGDTLEISKANLQEMTDYLGKMQERFGRKLLWGTANCFSHPRYAHGAATSCQADVFAYAAAQIKNAIDATVRLGGSGYVFWGGREGYETLLNTDMGFEMDNLARMLCMAVQYGRKNGFQGDFYIEPKPKEPTKAQYDFDASTVISFLQKYGLEKEFKLNIEANHATLAGHTFQHELRVARINGLFGSIDANQGDLLLGWDTDQFPTNVYDTTLCMYEVIKAGGFRNGGLNFDAKIRRGSFEFVDLAHAYVGGMDAFALGFKMARRLIEDGRLDSFVTERYQSYRHGIGAEIVDGRTDFERLEKYAMGLSRITLGSGRQEQLENLVNSILFAR
jgi:xylose isomerase